MPASELSFTEMDVLQEIYEVGGYMCDGNPNATVWRPDSDGIYPLIAFGHGLGGGDNNLYKMYGIMQQVANAGYVVIANMSGTIELKCVEGEAHDMVHNIEWAKENTHLSQFIDWNKPVGVTGYSMGGAATHTIAKNSLGFDLDALNIGAGMAMHGGELLEGDVN